MIVRYADVILALRGEGSQIRLEVSCRDAPKVAAPRRTLFLMSDELGDEKCYHVGQRYFKLKSGIQRARTRQGSAAETRIVKL